MARESYVHLEHEKGSIMQNKSSMPLTILVGIARIPVLVNSAAFRRTIREAAQVSAERHPDRRPMTRAVQQEKRLLQSVLTAL